MLKKEKGITLISLIIYVIAMTLLVAVIANISQSFYKNMSQFSDTDSIEFKVEKFNTFFLKQINESDIDVNIFAGEQTEITFDDGTEYVYNSTDKAIYYKNETEGKNIKICDEIESMSFEYDSAENTITVEISDGTTPEPRKLVYKKK